MNTSNEKKVVLADFGSEFGELTRHDIGQLFVDIHATISPLDPLNKEMALE